MRLRLIGVLVRMSLIIIFAAGCATITTKRADIEKEPEGIRVYPPRVYLFVDKEKGETTVVYAPDFSRAYDVKPLTVLARQEFKVEIEDGQLKTLTSNQDTTAILDFIKATAQLGAKAAGLGVSGGSIKGSFGLDSGIYELTKEGSFKKLPN